MSRKLGLAFSALGVALLGAAPTEQMLCFHQDGRAFLEEYREDCCASECAERHCPDDQCRDLPLALDDDESLDVPSVEASPASFVDAGLSTSLGLTRPRFSLYESLDPPESQALTLLRTVVLRF